MAHQRGDYAERWKHIKPAYLIQSTKDFIVFIDDEGDLDWETSREFDERNPELDPKLNSIINDAATLETTPCEGLSKEMNLHFKRLIGEGIARGLDGDFAGGMNMLSAAETYLQSRSQETSRRWYLTASSLMTLPFLLVGCIFWLCRKALIFYLGSGAFWVALSTVAGALGALLSVISRTGKLSFDCSSGKALHYLEGASRIWAGALSGVIVSLGVRTQMLLAPLSQGDKGPAVMLLAGFAAGAGERLASSIISKVNADGSKTLTTKN